MAPKVLVSDKLSETAVQIFRDRGIDVDFMPDLGKDKEKLAEVIGQYDGLAIRSATKVTPTILKHATNLKVVGRAGIGTTMSIKRPRQTGCHCYEYTLWQMITTAEHAIAMMFAVARQILEASESTHAGKWEKSTMGVELTGKTLGVIGAGNIGGIVCDRARGLKMKVMAFDPFLGEEKAKQMGVKKVELDELLAAADFITLHVPFTETTKNILSRENLAKTKKGVRIINCARGGLVDEVALAELLRRHVAGAAFDVFSVEPATENPLFNLPNVVCTPHLGAATTEAQENVALQVADQMSNYLLSGAVENALNMPSMTAEEAKIMGPWVKLADHLGNFVGQMTDEPITAINILYDGSVAEMNLDARIVLLLQGLKKANPDVNMVSAPVIAKERVLRSAPRTKINQVYLQVISRLQSSQQNANVRSAAQCSVMENHVSFRSKALISTPKSAQTCFIQRTKTSRHHWYLGSDVGSKRCEHRQLYPWPQMQVAKRLPCFMWTNLSKPLS